MSARTHYLLAAATLLNVLGCTGYITTPTPQPPQTPLEGISRSFPCPTGIPDEPTDKCPRLKNINLMCGGDGQIAGNLKGGSGAPFVMEVNIANGSNLSAVLVNQTGLCKDGPREGIALALTYTGQILIPESGRACISRSKTDYSQFLIGNPVYAPLETLAKNKLHETLDKVALDNLTAFFGLRPQSVARCGIWREWT